MGDFQNQGQQQYQDQQQAQTFSKKHEGEVKIKTRGKKSTSDTKDMGYFVDFEEVDE